MDEIQFLDEDGNVEEKKIISKAEEKSHKKQKRTFRPFEINPDMIQKDTASVNKPEKKKRRVFQKKLNQSRLKMKREEYRRIY